MSAAMYDNAVALFTAGELRWADDQMRGVLVGPAYEPLQSEDRTRADLRGQIGAPVSVLGREIVAGETPGQVTLKAGALRFGRITGEFRWLVLYQSNGSPESDNLVAYMDLGNQRMNNGVPILEFSQGGVCQFSVAMNG